MVKGGSAQKAARQAQARRLANRSVRRKVKTFIRHAEETISRGGVDTAPIAVRQSIVALDKAASSGRLPRNNAARRKSRLMKKLNSALGSS